MRTEETLILGREDLIANSETKPFILIDFQDFEISIKPFQENTIIIFIDNDGKTKILKNRFGNDDLGDRIDWIKFSELQPNQNRTFIFY